MTKDIDHEIGQGRVCLKCGEWKYYVDFYKHPFGDFGRNSKCKECSKEYARLRRLDPQAREKISQSDKKRKVNDEYRAKRRLSMVAKRSDPEFKMAKKMRAVLGRCISHFGLKKSESTFSTLGYTPSMLRQRIECQFEAGMSWENYGRFGWHIDHKKPILAFFNQGVTDLRTINALCNLQPLWAEDNIAKGWKWPAGTKDNLRRPDAARLTAANDNKPMRGDE